MIPGASESWRSVRMIFNSIDFKPFYAMSLQYRFTVLWPNDGKMQNLLLGLQNHSSFNPSPYCHFSQYSQCDEHHIVRTINTILDDNQQRIDRNEPANRHHSVADRPIQPLIDHPNDNLLEVNQKIHTKFCDAAVFSQSTAQVSKIYHSQASQVEVFYHSQIA